MIHRLRRRERSVLVRAAILGLLALVVLGFDNVLLSGIVWIGFAPKYHYAWWRTFACFFPLTVVLLLCLDRLTPWPDSVDEMAGGDGLMTGGGHLELWPSSYGIGGANGAGTAILTVLLLAGPRLLRTAVGRLTAIVRAGHANRAEAGRLLRRLESIDHEVFLQDLLKSDGEAQSRHACVSYLLQYGWLDTSADGTRVWLTTETRTLLAKTRVGFRS